jgi:hypothetical protein
VAAGSRLFPPAHAWSLFFILVCAGCPASDRADQVSCNVDDDCPLRDQICASGICTVGSNPDHDSPAPDAGEGGPGDAGSLQDAGAPLDAGSNDAGVATPPDSGLSDAGPLDSGAGVEEAGPAPEDAGQPTDAGAIQDSGHDSGNPVGMDSGAEMDSGISVDAGGSPMDAGPSAPPLVLDFLGAQWPALVNFNRASTATYFDATGTLKTAAINVPRIGVDPRYGLPLGLLIEGARTNHISHSGSLYNSAHASVDGTREVGPLFLDGMGNWTRLVAAGTGQARIDESSGSTHQDKVMTFSVFAKRGTNRFAALSAYFGAGNPAPYVMFDLDAGAVAKSWHDDAQSFSYTIQPISDGVARISLTARQPDTGSANWKVHQTNGVDYWVASGTGDHVFYSGMQLEEGHFPSSYIPTLGGPSTRAADVAQVDQMDWYVEEQGSLILAVLVPQLPQSGGGDRNLFSLEGSTRTFRAGISPDGHTQVNYLNNALGTSPGQWRPFAFRQVAVTFGPGAPADLKMSELGMNIDLNNVGDLFVDPVESLHLGARRNGDSLFGYLRTFIYTAAPLSDGELRQLTNTTGASGLNLNFDDNGNPLAGWVDTNYQSSLYSNDALFDVCSVQGDQALCALGDSDYNHHSHLVTWGMHDLANIEMTGRMRGALEDAGLGVTFLSQFPYADQYYRLRRYASEPEYTLSHHGLTFGCQAPSTGITPTANTWSEFRIQVESTESETTLRARVWLSGDTEPLGWQAVCTDTNADRLINGTIGVWAGGLMGTGARYWDDLVVTPLP